MSSDLIKAFRSVLSEAIPTVAVMPAVGKNEKLPMAIFSVRNGIRETFYHGSFGMRRTEFTVSIYSQSYAELQDLKETVILTFHGLSGSLGNQEISKCEVGTVLDGFDDDTETVFKSILVINVTD